MKHLGPMPLSFGLRMAAKAAEERETQAAWEMYVATAPWAGDKAPSFAEYLDKFRKGRRQGVRRAKMTPEEIERKFDAIVEAHLKRKAEEVR